MKTLTFDGAASNMSMANALGAKLFFPDVKTYILHPITKEKVFIFFDPCHMLKLCRNTLGDWQTLYDKDGQEIKWDLFKQIVHLQENAQLHLATKIRSKHINYYKEKMKVKLAAQTLSESVAKALIYCNEQKIPNFENTHTTSEFCQQINNIFDVLNTRNFLGKTQFKRPIYINNELFLNSFISSSVKYISSLQTKKI